MAKFCVTKTENKHFGFYIFTHWGLAMHMCISEPDHHWFRKWLDVFWQQAITLTSNHVLSVGPLGKIFNRIWNKIQAYCNRDISFKGVVCKMHTISRYQHAKRFWCWRCIHVYIYTSEFLHKMWLHNKQSRGHFTKAFYPQFRFDTYSFYCKSILGNQIATKVCICHGSTAVRSCAKFCSNYFISIWLKKCHCSWITMGQYLVTLVPRIFL